MTVLFEAINVGFFTKMLNNSRASSRHNENIEHRVCNAGVVGSSPSGSNDVKSYNASVCGTCDF